MGHIYILTFSNGKSYIGQTTNIISRRFSSHKAKFKSGAKTPLYVAWGEFGEPTIEILATDNTLDELEKQFIEQHSTKHPNGYNKYDGGKKGFSIPKSEEWKKDISEKLKGRQFSDEHRANLSKAIKGKPISEAKRQALRDGWVKRKANH